jgi:hypothetical protein
MQIVQKQKESYVRKEIAGFFDLAADSSRSYSGATAAAKPDIIFLKKTIYLLKP